MKTLNKFINESLIINNIINENEMDIKLSPLEYQVVANSWNSLGSHAGNHKMPEIPNGMDPEEWHKALAEDKKRKEQHEKEIAENLKKAIEKILKEFNFKEFIPKYAELQVKYDKDRAELENKYKQGSLDGSDYKEDRKDHAVKFAEALYDVLKTTLYDKLKTFEQQTFVSLFTDEKHSPINDNIANAIKDAAKTQKLDDNKTSRLLIIMAMYISWHREKIVRNMG